MRNRQIFSIVFLHNTSKKHPENGTQSPYTHYAMPALALTRLIRTSQNHICKLPETHPYMTGHSPAHDHRHVYRHRRTSVCDRHITPTLLHGPLPYLLSASHTSLPVRTLSPQHGMPRRLFRLRLLFLPHPLQPQQEEGGRRTMFTRRKRQIAAHSVTMTMTMMSCVMTRRLCEDVF